MNLTTNYNLKKPEYTDVADIVDINDNMDAIDAKLKELEIGSRTIDQAIVTAPANTGTLTQLFSWIAKQLTAITGKANWYDVPATTIEELDTNRISKTLITAANDFIVGTASATVAKKTLAETKTILGINAASTSATGVVELATNAEVTAGTDTARAVTPAGLKVELDKKIPLAVVTAANDFIVGTASATVAKKTLAETKTILGINAASESATGVVELATAAEVTAGTDTTKVVTPAGLKVELDKINDVLGSGVVATPSLSYGMNSKIVNPVKVPVIPEVTWSGRHYVNLLGKDGNCEDVSKWSAGNGSTSILDSATRIFGANSIKLTHNQVSTDYSFIVEDLTTRIDKNKYYCISAYAKCGTCSHIYAVFGANAGWRNGNFVFDKNNFQRSFAKASPADMASSSTFGMYIILIPSGAAGSYVGTGWIDGIMLTEITQAEYNDAGYEPPPYVDSYGILTNPYIEVRHDNLVRNGNGEEGINWWSLGYGNYNPIFENGYFVVDDRNASANNGYYQIIPCKPNTQYTFSTVAKVGTSTKARIQIGEIDESNPPSVVSINQGLTANTTDTKISATLTTSANAKHIIVTMISGDTVANTGTAYHKEAILIEGSSTPVYTPCRMERCVIEGKFADGDIVSLKNGKAEGLVNWKHRTLYGKDYDWQFYYDRTGAKTVKMPITGAYHTTSFVGDNAKCIKYDGKILFYADPTSGDLFDIWTDDYVYIAVSDTDTGWSETVNPNADEVKAFMNGWKAVGSYNSRYVVWVSALDGNVLPPGGLITAAASTANTGQAVINFTDASQFNVGDLITVKNSAGAWNSYVILSKSTNAVTMSSNLMSAISSGAPIIRADNGTTNVSLLNWCKNNIAAGYEGYQLHYKLANPEPITDVNTKVVGDIPKIDTGDNYVYVDSGMVLGEVATPTNIDYVGGINSAYYFINSISYPNGLLHNKIQSHDSTYKNDIYYVIGSESAMSPMGSYGMLDFYIATANYDSTAIYSIDYKILSTIAPNVGAIALAFKQDLVSGVTSVANALESRQKSDSALDSVIDLSVYEVFDCSAFDVFLPYIVANDGTCYLNIPFEFKISKKAIPIIQLLNLKISAGTDYSDITRSFKFNFVKLNRDRGVIGLYAPSSTFNTSLKGAGIYANYKIIADCRGRI